MTEVVNLEQGFLAPDTVWIVFWKRQEPKALKSVDIQVKNPSLMGIAIA